MNNEVNEKKAAAMHNFAAACVVLRANGIEPWEALKTIEWMEKSEAKSR